MMKTPVSRETHTTLSESWLVKEDQNTRYFQVPDSMFKDAIRAMKDEGKILVCLFAVETLENYDGLSLLYIFEDRESPQFQILILPCIQDPPISIAKIFP
ncbi:MAG: hypothetical protein CVV33_02615, partial [Methanomicrobiales archaeon HGW-Methanomicrobiales-4]